ncbi:hypothetical protein SAMN05444920_13746 [Nonomuraea solani]|uniref:Uncharacterized protein n=1 Tax=Nonomuraea solani TaxID=1144553 RepID=A0A1H6F2X0_9ACTN|nr:hypothetical protein [Nonomuraea solani]SEH03486.1 hypothetical protein SAMN05444920_13746 [Nonomuraea solani]
MLRRHRSARPALLVAGLYAAALTFAVVAALISGNLGPLWWLTLFTPVTEGATATGQNLLLLVLAGVFWTWGIWQVLRGPLAGPPPDQDQRTLRLRVAFYVATAATWLGHVIASLAGVDATVIDSAVMWVVVLLFMRVLGGDRPYMRGAGVLGYGGFTVISVVDLTAGPILEGLELICGLACLAWLALALRAQGYDDRWGTATVVYGIASLVAPILLVLVAMPLPAEGSAVEALGVVASVLIMIWLARSAHDLAAPRQAERSNRSATLA